MSIGVWFIYGREECLAGTTELAHRLADDPDVQSAEVNDGVLRLGIHDPLTGNDAEVLVARDNGSHVALEAVQLADDPPPVDVGVPTPDLTELRGSDTRLEITWDLVASDETYNVMLVIVDVVREACPVIAYDATNHRFV